MNMHYVGLYESNATSNTYSDYIIINDEQLALLKWFFKRLLDKCGFPYDCDDNAFRYTFVENDPAGDEKYWEPFVENDSNNVKTKIVIYTDEFGLEFFTLTYSQIDMLDYLHDFIGDNYFTFTVIEETSFSEIS